MIGPLIPGLSDRDIPKILKRAAECGAESASYVPLRLAGNVAPVFFQRIRAQLPDHARRIEQRIRDMRGGKLNEARFGHRMTGAGEYWRSIEQLFAAAAKKYGLDYRDRPRASADVNEPQVKQSRQLPLFGELP
jgi:DNA repair photolyase